jgi:hypothetical protein
MDQLQVAELFTDFVSWNRLLEESIQKTEEIFAFSVRELRDASFEQAQDIKKELALKIKQHQLERSKYLQECSALVKNIVELKDAEILYTPMPNSKVTPATDPQKDTKFELRAMQKLLQHFKNELKRERDPSKVSKMKRDIIHIKEQIIILEEALQPKEQRRRTHDGVVLTRRPDNYEHNVEHVRQINFDETHHFDHDSHISGLDSELFENMIGHEEHQLTLEQIPPSSPVSTRDMMLIAKTAPVVSPHHITTPDRRTNMEHFNKISPIYAVDTPQQPFSKQIARIKTKEKIAKQVVQNMHERDRMHSALVPNHYGLQNSIQLGIRGKSREHQDSVYSFGSPSMK